MDFDSDTFRKSTVSRLSNDMQNSWKNRMSVKQSPATAIARMSVKQNPASRMSQKVRLMSIAFDDEEEH
jgi:hypothetical protein